MPVGVLVPSESTMMISHALRSSSGITGSSSHSKRLATLLLVIEGLQFNRMALMKRSSSSSLKSSPLPLAFTISNNASVRHERPRACARGEAERFARVAFDHVESSELDVGMVSLKPNEPGL